MPFPKVKTLVSLEEAPFTGDNVQKTAKVESVYRDPKAAVAFLANLVTSVVLGIMCIANID